MHEVDQCSYELADYAYCDSDNCATSIVHLFRSCCKPGCTFDLCLTCCQELRLRKSRQTGVNEVETFCQFPNWDANLNGSIPCPLKECGGRETLILQLICNLKVDCIDKVLEDSLSLVNHFNIPDTVSSCCLWCNQIDVRKAAFWEKHDDFLYCPTVGGVKVDDIEHFQRHCMKGEPVIVKNVLDKSSGLS